MHCFEIMLKNRFRGDKKHQTYSTSSHALLGARGSTPLDKGRHSHHHHHHYHFFHHSPLRRTVNSSIPPKRDRSRSLCVDRSGPLIQVEPKASDDSTKAAALFTRRRSTNTLWVPVFQQDSNTCLIC